MASGETNMETSAYTAYPNTNDCSEAFTEACCVKGM